MITLSEFPDYYRRLAGRRVGSPSTAEAQRDYRAAVAQILWGFQRNF